MVYFKIVDINKQLVMQTCQTVREFSDFREKNIFEMSYACVLATLVLNFQRKKFKPTIMSVLKLEQALKHTNMKCLLQQKGADN